MTLKENLEFCKVCKNRKSEKAKGIICGLTNELADFESTCNFFMEDHEEKERLEDIRIEHELFMKSASQGKRFANYILDIIFFYIFSFVVGVLLAVISTITSTSLLSFLDEDNKLKNYAFGFVIMMTYFLIFEGITGRSLAKYITKTKVVDERGQKPDFGTIFIRTLCRFIPFEVFSFLSSDATGWHDTISKTRVVEI